MPSACLLAPKAGEGLGNYVPSEDKPILPNEEDQEKGECMDTQPVLMNCDFLLPPSLAMALEEVAGVSRSEPSFNHDPSTTGPLHSLLEGEY